MIENENIPVCHQIVSYSRKRKEEGGTRGNWEEGEGGELGEVPKYEFTFPRKKKKHKYTLSGYDCGI